jgi:hypothetical protein
VLCLSSLFNLTPAVLCLSSFSSQTATTPISSFRPHLRLSSPATAGESGIQAITYTSNQPNHQTASSAQIQTTPPHCRCDRPQRCNKHGTKELELKQTVRPNMARTLRSQSSTAVDLSQTSAFPVNPEMSSTATFQASSPSLDSAEFGSAGQIRNKNNNNNDNNNNNFSVTSPSFSAPRSIEQEMGPSSDFKAQPTSNNMDSSKATGFQTSFRRPGPPPHVNTAPDPRMLTPSLRQSASFSAGDKFNSDMVPSPSDPSLYHR